MDNDYNEFSSMENQIDNLPEEIKPDDIQDFANFPRDSFVDLTPNNYFNNNKQPFQQQHFPVENKTQDNDSSNDEIETGYSNSFLQTMPKYQQIPQYKNSNYLSKSNNYNYNINYYNNNYNNNYNNINTYHNISRNPNINNNNFQKQKYYSYNKNNSNNQIYKPIIPNPQPQGPIPQDTEIEEEQEQEQEQEEIFNDEENNIIDQNELNRNNINNNNNNNYEENIPLPEVNDEDNYNNEKQKTNETPAFDQKKLQELLSICKKKGEPPSDKDFSFDSWKVFYPETEKFFLWKKGKVIPNQVIIKNENDPNNIEIYEGEINFQKEKHGKGRMTTPNYTRIGTWRDDEFTGWGRESRINGDVFEGRFVDGAIYGKGINQNKKGNTYVGEFVDNKREGKGELKTDKINYIGEFKYDKLNGKGKLKFLKHGHEYEGEFKNNEINGMGIFKWSNGETYEGEMTNGKMNGYGKYKYSNGQIYEGTYVNGVKEGLGKLISPNNNIYEGEFKNGRPEGEGILYNNGKKINVIYKDGKFMRK